MAELFKNQVGTDAVLVCQDVHWEVHAAVLLARCRETRAINEIADCSLIKPSYTNKQVVVLGSQTEKVECPKCSTLWSTTYTESKYPIRFYRNGSFRSF